MEVDLAGDQRLVHGGDVADQLGALEDALGGFGEFRDLVVGVLAERIEAGDAAEVEDVPVVGFQHAVFLVVGRIVPQVPALVLGGGAADLVGVDDEAIGPEALRHAEQLVARIVHRPFVGRLERRHHLVEERLEAGAVERLDQLFREHDLARPGIVDVDQVPDLGLAGAQPVDHGRIVGERFGLDRRALRLAERIEHLGGIVAFPAQDVQFLLALPPKARPSASDPPAAKAAAKGPTAA